MACHAVDWHPRACHGLVTLAVVLQLPDIDRASPVPPYRQVASFLADAIRAGDYPPGSRLPSLNDLGQRYGIARRTASKALGLLAGQGLAEYSDGMGHFALAQAPDETAMRPDGGGPDRTGPDETGSKCR